MVAERLAIPVVTAGGFGDGRGFVAAKELIDRMVQQAENMVEPLEEKILSS
jgi:NAD(P)H-dependent flavin oxidoreductase YrpB (nitropropane dioxygenase family)